MRHPPLNFLAGKIFCGKATKAGDSMSFNIDTIAKNQ